jgi:ABC-type branched-subunit amino acid transport system substrate-binding protein
MYTIVHAITPVRVGVLMPLSNDFDIRETLEWAKDSVNQCGGIGGRPLELVYLDTNAGDTQELAKKLLNDDSVQIVLGPPWAEVLTVAYISMHM